MYIHSIEYWIPTNDCHGMDVIWMYVCIVYIKYVQFWCSLLPVFGESKSFIKHCIKPTLQLFVLNVDRDDDANNLCITQDVGCVLPCNSEHK